MKTFVCGFMFSETDMDTVVLIRKNRPDWQAGKLNGVGGHQEAGETPWQAMVREFREETGAVTFENQWRHFCTIHGDATGRQIETEPWMVDVFWTLGDVTLCHTMTDETIEVHRVSTVTFVQENTKWLLQMALASWRGKEPKRFFRVEYVR